MFRGEPRVGAPDPGQPLRDVDRGGDFKLIEDLVDVRAP
jgi:hypothetical protein